MNTAPPETSLFSNTAEEAILGYSLIHPEACTTADLLPDDFYIHKNRAIWEAMLSLRDKRQPIDMISLIDELERAGKLSEAGGATRLAELMNQYPYNFEAESGASSIRDYASRRSMLLLANDIAKAAWDTKTGVSERAGEFIERISRLSRSSSGAVHWGKFLSELYDDIERRSQNPDETWGISTGFPGFDRATGGLQPGESTIFSGKPGVGKSILAMQMGQQMAKSSPGAIYSVEMKGIQVARRIVSAHSQIFSSKLKAGKLADDDWPQLTGTIEQLERLPIYMSDSAGWTTSGLRADLARLKATYDIRWFVFDYMLLAGDMPERDRNERTELISRNFKLICRDLDLAGLVVHSMNKEGIEKTRPDMGNLAGSAQVSYDADLICILTDFQPITSSDNFIPPAEQKNMRTLSFVKGREMEEPKKYLHLVKLSNLPQFGEYAPEPNAQRLFPGNGRS